MKRSDVSLIALRRILRATELHGRKLAKASGLTTAQMLALQVLGTEGYSTPKEMASRMGVTQATISALIDRLEEKALVQRQRSDRDRRQTNVLLTEAGRAALETAPDPLQERYVRHFDALPDWEQAMIVAGLERVAGLLNADQIDASPVLDLGDIVGDIKRPPGRS